MDRFLTIPGWKSLGTMLLQLQWLPSCTSPLHSGQPRGNGCSPHFWYLDPSVSRVPFFSPFPSTVWLIFY